MLPISRSLYTISVLALITSAVVASTPCNSTSPRYAGPTSTPGTDPDKEQAELQANTNFKNDCISLAHSLGQGCASCSIAGQCVENVIPDHGSGENYFFDQDGDGNWVCILSTPNGQYRVNCSSCN